LSSIGTTSAAGMGELRWEQAGVGATYGRVNAGVYPNSGALNFWPSATTLNTGGGIVFPSTTSDENSIVQNSYWPLLDSPGWKVTFVFSIMRDQNVSGGYTAVAFNLTRSSFYIGLGAQATSGMVTRRPAAFFGCRYDTDTTAPSIGDTTFHLEACMNTLPTTSTTVFNAQGTNGGTFDTGIIPAEGVYYRLEISCTAADSVTITLNGVGTTFTLTKVVSSAVGSLNIIAGNGAVQFGGTCTGTTNINGYLGSAPGSKFTIGGLSGGNLVDNGDYICIAQRSGLSAPNALSSTAIGAVGATFTLTGYPGLIPFASYWNDTTGAAPTVASRAAAIDYFSFVWNPNLGPNAPGTPDSTKSRYW
jgi:hypothetical protein